MRLCGAGVRIAGSASRQAAPPPVLGVLDQAGSQGVSLYASADGRKRYVPAVGQVLMGLVGIGLIVTGFAQSLGQFPPERRIYVIVPFIGALIVEVLGLVYPSVLLVLLGRRTMGKTLGPAEPGGPPVDS